MTLSWLCSTVIFVHWQAIVPDQCKVLFTVTNPMQSCLVSFPICNDLHSCFIAWIQSSSLSSSAVKDLNPGSPFYSNLTFNVTELEWVRSFKVNSLLSWANWAMSWGAKTYLISDDHQIALDELSGVMEVVYVLIIFKRDVLNMELTIRFYRIIYICKNIIMFLGLHAIW